MNAFCQPRGRSGCSRGTSLVGTRAREPAGDEQRPAAPPVVVSYINMTACASVWSMPPASSQRTRCMSRTTSQGGAGGSSSLVHARLQSTAARPPLARLSVTSRVLLRIAGGMDPNRRGRSHVYGRLGGAASLLIGRLSGDEFYKRLPRLHPDAHAGWQEGVHALEGHIWHLPRLVELGLDAVTPRSSAGHREPQALCRQDHVLRRNRPPDLLPQGSRTNIDRAVRAGSRRLWSEGDASLNASSAQAPAGE